MTTKQEVLTYLAKQVNDKKATIEFVKTRPYHESHDIIIDDWKKEIRLLLSAMDLVLESK